MEHAGGPPDAMDRLSALPDGLIHAILSFLPAPQVVRTSLLSRRWRRLWRSTPRIVIDQQDFGISVGISRGTLEERWARFEDFATNQLLFHDNTLSLGEFRLYSCIHNWNHVDRWIRRGLEYCPSILRIEIAASGNIGFKLPPVGSSFQRLKTLCLCRVHLDSHFMGSFCSACPILEDLKLIICDFCGNSSQGITSPTLNKLVLDSCANNTGYPLVITVPRLAYFSLIYGCYQSGVSLHKMDFLVNAEIYVTENETFSQQIQHELLCSLYNVTSLALGGFEVEGMLNEESDKFPIFHNMQTLRLGSCFLNEYELYDKLEALGSFLQSTPCLEKLILRYCMFYSFSDSEWENERKSITLHRQDGKTFQCQKLKLIEVIYDYDHDHQLIELVWSLARSLPDANIKLKKVGDFC